LGLLTLSLFWYAVGDAALVVAASEAYLGGAPAAGAALSVARSHAGHVIGATLYKVAVAMLGMLPLLALALVPAARAAGALPVVAAALLAVLWMAYIFLARYFAVPATVVLEGLPSRTAWRRARQLSAGETRRVFAGYALALAVYTLVLLSVGGAAYAIFRDAQAAQTVMSVFAIFVYPLLSAVTTLLYYDVRLRKEGHDIELMMQRLAVG
jgi:hypothetical protein